MFELRDRIVRGIESDNARLEAENARLKERVAELEAWKSQAEG